MGKGSVWNTGWGGEVEMKILSTNFYSHQENPEMIIDIPDEALSKTIILGGEIISDIYMIAESGLFFLDGTIESIIHSNNQQITLTVNRNTKKARFYTESWGANFGHFKMLYPI